MSALPSMINDASLSQSSQLMNDDCNPPLCSVPAHLQWRSVLGPSACWCGGRARGVFLDANAAGNDNKSLLQHVPSDRRMFHLTCSLRDRMVASTVPNDDRIHSDSSHSNDRQKRRCKGNNDKIQLLSHPRIVNAAPQTNRRYARAEGIACMDLNRGHDGESQMNSPSRYLLVGSAGSDCSIALYDLSYFGSDERLYSSLNTDRSFIQQHEQLPIAAVTHRPIARSLRQNEEESIQEIANMGSVPSGHRQPLLGVHWYPADHGSFVSASISGEILVWDAESFVPAYATTVHVYGHSTVNEVTKSVAPLQCIDLPKSPNACPHGKALLALGLGGGDGRGVIQLCDAFSGGSATHELVGHTGGVNAVAWDPTHPFRLASGGEDGTVRLWDVRKAGRHACLGVLDRDHGYFDPACENTAHEHSMKRQRITLNDSRGMEGIESHSGPISAIAFVPSGEELVTSGSDGSINLWDLRPDSCCVSSLAAKVGTTKSNAERGDMDPAVACGGRLYPFIFGLSSSNKETYNSRKRQRKQRYSKSTLTITQDGSRNTTTLYATRSTEYSKGQIAVYSLFDDHQSKGGQANAILNGHLDDITCISPVIGSWDNLGTGIYKQSNNVRLLSAGKDGIILSWGVPTQKDPLNNTMLTPDVNECISNNRSHILSLLNQQRQNRLDRINRQYRDGIINSRQWHDSIYGDDDQSQDNFIDSDNW